MSTIALIFTNWGPYHIARLEALSRLCESIGWKAVGIELAGTEQKYPWKVEHSRNSYQLITVAPDQALETISALNLAVKTQSVLGKVQPDILAIAGYSPSGMLAALAWGVWHRKARVLMSDSIPSLAGDKPRSKLKEFPKRVVVSLYQAAMAAGAPQTRYLEQLGIPNQKIFGCYDVVDNAAFTSDTFRNAPYPLVDRPKGTPFFLAVKRFVPDKNILALLDSYATYRASYLSSSGDQPWDLVLCGDGALRSQIEQRIAELGLKSFVHLPGFLQQSQLLPYFAHAQALVHTSIYEVWGLVVNEAMAAGLPVLVAKSCGCFEDLVFDGVNGFGFDPTNVAQITAAMQKISGKSVDRMAMGQASLKLIQQFSPETFANNLIQASNCALQSGYSLLTQTIST